MKAKVKFLFVLFVFGMSLDGVAQRLSYSADFTGVSNYIFRGQSLSDDGFALQAAFNIENDKGWRYRFLGSTYDVNGDTDGRAEFSLDYRGETDRYLDVMFGVTVYGYESESLESNEWHVGLSAFDVSVMYYRDEERDTQYYDYAYFYELTDSIRFDVHYGIARPIYQTGSTEDYSLGASYQLMDELKLFVTAGSHDELDDFALVGATYFWQ